MCTLLMHQTLLAGFTGCPNAQAHRTNRIWIFAPQNPGAGACPYSWCVQCILYRIRGLLREGNRAEKKICLREKAPSWQCQSPSFFCFQ
jgi:hypothetical protein